MKKNKKEEEEEEVAKRVIRRWKKRGERVIRPGRAGLTPLVRSGVIVGLELQQPERDGAQELARLSAAVLVVERDADAAEDVGHRDHKVPVPLLTDSGICSYRSQACKRSIVQTAIYRHIHHAVNAGIWAPCCVMRRQKAL